MINIKKATAEDYYDYLKEDYDRTKAELDKIRVQYDEYNARVKVLETALDLIVEYLDER